MAKLFTICQCIEAVESWDTIRLLLWYILLISFSNWFRIYVIKKYFVTGKMQCKNHLYITF